MISDPVERKRELIRNWQRDKIAKSNDVGAPRKLTKTLKARRARATKSLKYFLTHLFDESVFYRKFSKTHLTFIENIEAAYATGGNLVVAMPRGSGKSTLLLRAICWASLCGISRYPILVTADDVAYLRAMRAIKTIFETNDQIAELWPEVIEPIRAINSANAANYQTCHGQPTYLRWSLANGLQFADTPYTREAGNASCNIGGGGLTSSKLRGCVQTLPDGRALRPTVALVDDPSNRESAQSERQNQNRLDIIKSDIAKMGGPGMNMSVLVACTAIEPNDLAERLLCDKISPQYTALRVKMLEAFPKNLDLWQEYRQIAVEEQLGEQPKGEHHRFYQANQKKMDAGARHYWPDRIEAGFVSAIESAMYQWLEDPRSFASECQNEPEHALFSDLPPLEVESLVDRQHAWPRGVVPPDVTKIVAHIDCQAWLLYYTVVGFTNKFKAYVLDFGTWPRQIQKSFTYDYVKENGLTLQKHYNGADMLGAFRQGIADLVSKLSEQQWPRSDGKGRTKGFSTIDLGLIDARFQPVEVEAALQHARKPGWAPCYGVGIGAKGQPLRPRDKNAGTQGLHWVSQIPASGRLLMSLFVDVNYWKDHAHKGLLCPPLHSEAILLPAGSRSDNQMPADSYVSEVAVAVTAKGRTVNEWALKAPSGQNHLWDNLVACLAGASYLGIKTQGPAPPRPEPGDYIEEDQDGKAYQYEDTGDGWAGVDDGWQ